MLRLRRRAEFGAAFLAAIGALVIGCAAGGARANAALPPASASPLPAPPSLPVASVSAMAGTPASDESAWPFVPAPSDNDQKAQLDRLLAEPGPIRSNWVPPGKSARYGHAEGIVGAPYGAVKARLLDFARYRELAGPKFKNVRVVDKTAEGTEVYFQLPIMHGVVSIWYVTRFRPMRPAPGGVELLTGSFVRGNIKDMHIVFSIRPAPGDTTVLGCDLTLAIHLPAPQDLLDEELRDACGDAIHAVRARTKP